MQKTKFPIQLGEKQQQEEVCLDFVCRPSFVKRRWLGNNSAIMNALEEGRLKRDVNILEHIQYQLYQQVVIKSCIREIQQSLSEPCRGC